MCNLIGIVLLLLTLSQSAVAGNDVLVPSDLSVQFSAQPDNGIEPGDFINFSVTVVNHGPEIVDLITLVSSEFFGEIDINTGSQDCTLVLSVGNDVDPVPSGTGNSTATGKGGEPFFIYFWYPIFDGGPIQVGESRTCTFSRPATSLMPPVWPFSFGLLSSTYVDLDPTNDASTVILRRGALPTTLPALSPLALLLLVAGLALCAGLAMRRQQASCKR